MSEGDYLKKLGEDFRRQRLELRMSKTAVATAIGVHVTTLTTWEKGGAAMSVVSEKRLEMLFKREREQRAAARAARAERRAQMVTA